MRVSSGSFTMRTISRTLPSKVTMMCSGIGGKGNALNTCEVGEKVGDEEADDVGESIVRM